MLCRMNLELSLALADEWMVLNPYGVQSADLNWNTGNEIVSHVLKIPETNKLLHIQL
jgi:hypothetical protein